MNLYTIVYPDIRKGETEKSGGYVEVHRLHNKQELELNLRTTILLAQQGHKVRLLAISDTLLLDEQITVEFKHNQKSTRSAIDSELKKAQEQANHIVLHILSKIRKGDLINALTNRLNRAKGVKIIWLVWKGRMYRFTRKEVLDKAFRDKIE